MTSVTRFCLQLRKSLFDAIIKNSLWLTRLRQPQAYHLLNSRAQIWQLFCLLSLENNKRAQPVLARGERCWDDEICFPRINLKSKENRISQARAQPDFAFSRWGMMQWANFIGARNAAMRINHSRRDFPKGTSLRSAFQSTISSACFCSRREILRRCKLLFREQA